MADAAAGAGQKQRATRSVIARVRHGCVLNFHSGIKPRLGPGLIRRVAAEYDAVVQSERAIVPKFELGRRDPPAAPARRARYVADDVGGDYLGDRLFEGETAFERLRLLARPRSNLGLFRPGGEIGVGLCLRKRRHVAAYANLPPQRFPIE